MSGEGIHVRLFVDSVTIVDEVGVLSVDITLLHLNKVASKLCSSRGLGIQERAAF